MFIEGDSTDSIQATAIEERLQYKLSLFLLSQKMGSFLNVGMC